MSTRQLHTHTTITKVTGQYIVCTCTVWGVHVYCVGSVCVLCGECMCTVWGVYVYRVGSVQCRGAGGVVIVWFLFTKQGEEGIPGTRHSCIGLHYFAVHTDSVMLYVLVCTNFLRTIIVAMCLVSSQYGTYCSSMEQEP